MRVGELVRREDSWEGGSPNLTGPVGTIIAIDEEASSEENAKVRWEDGRVETMSTLDLHEVTPRLYVNYYVYDRAYGGPEEGGWWYDTYAPLDESYVGVEVDPGVDLPRMGLYESEEAALEAYQQARALMGLANEGRRPVSSVLSEGEITVHLEAWPAEYSPARRPYYC